MPRALSTDLRSRIVAYQERTGAGRTELARVFSIGPATAYRLVMRMRTTNSVEPTQQVHESTHLIADDKLEALRTLVDEKSDRTLAELVEAWKVAHKVAVSAATLHRALVRAGISRKKSRSGPASVYVRTSSSSAMPSALKSSPSSANTSSTSTRPA